jgi:hypothetical protein
MIFNSDLDALTSLSSEQAKLYKTSIVMSNLYCFQIDRFRISMRKWVYRRTA